MGFEEALAVKELSCEGLAGGHVCVLMSGSFRTVEGCERGIKGLGRARDLEGGELIGQRKEEGLAN